MLSKNQRDCGNSRSIFVVRGSTIIRHWLIFTFVIINPSFLVAADDSADAVRRLVNQLGSDQFQERDRATKELIDLGEPALAALRHAAKSNDREVARRAAQCVDQIEKNLKVATLAKGLLNPESNVRAASIDGLFGIEPENAIKALPETIKAIDYPDTNTRFRVAALLGHIGPLAKDAVPRMLEKITDTTEVEDVRWAMVVNLGKIGQCSFPFGYA
jgi:HEAT repeat protein